MSVACLLMPWLPVSPGHLFLLLLLISYHLSNGLTPMNREPVALIKEGISVTCISIIGEQCVKLVLYIAGKFSFPMYVMNSFEQKITLLHFVWSLHLDLGPFSISYLELSNLISYWTSSSNPSDLWSFSQQWCFGWQCWQSQRRWTHNLLMERMPTDFCTYIDKCTIKCDIYVFQKILITILEHPRYLHINHSHFFAKWFCSKSLEVKMKNGQLT